MKHTDTRKPNAAPCITVLLLGLATAVLGSCSASTGLLLRADGSAVLSASFDMPTVVEQRLKALAGSDASVRSGSFFNPELIAGDLSGRGFRVQESRLPTPQSYAGVFALPDLARFLREDSDMRTSGMLKLTEGAGWTELRLEIRKDNAQTLLTLFPGIDMQLVESLSPPALFDLPITKDEYRSMLAALLGQNAISAIDRSLCRFSLQLPGAILEAEGGTVGADRRSLEVSLPVLDAMVLEQPVLVRVRWSK